MKNNNIFFQLELEKNLTEVVYPKFLQYLENMLKENGGEWLVGDKVIDA